MTALAAALAGALAACGDGAGPNPRPDDTVTMTVEFAEPVTQADVAALEAVGGEHQYTLELARTVVMRGSAEYHYLYDEVPGVARNQSLGPERNPSVRIRVHYATPATSADSAYLAAKGVEVEAQDQGTWIGTVDLEDVRGIEPDGRITRIYVFARGLVPIE